MSITSIWYLPFNCSSQINLRLLKAVTAFGTCPATYKRNTQSSLLALADGSFRSTSRLRPDGRRLDSSRSIDPLGVFDRLVFDFFPKGWIPTCLIFTASSLNIFFLLVCTDCFYINITSSTLSHFYLVLSETFIPCFFNPDNFERF